MAKFPAQYLQEKHDCVSTYSGTVTGSPTERQQVNPGRIGPESKTISTNAKNRKFGGHPASPIFQSGSRRMMLPIIPNTITPRPPDGTTLWGSREGLRLASCRMVLHAPATLPPKTKEACFASPPAMRGPTRGIFELPMLGPGGKMVLNGAAMYLLFAIESWMVGLYQ